MSLRPPPSLMMRAQNMREFYNIFAEFLHELKLKVR
jgi:hypothetical protein